MEIPWYVKLFLAFGGAAALIGFAHKQIKAVVKWALKAAMDKWPLVRAWVFAHKADIDAFFEDMKAGADEAIAEEAAEDAQPKP